MALPYFLRLLCLCLSVFFLTYVAVTLLASLAMPWALDRARRLRPSSAANLLFGLRMFPAALSVVFIALFCIPSYLWLEPDFSRERVGYACLIAAAFGAAIVLLGLARGGLSLLRTKRYLDRCTRSGRKLAVNEREPMLLVAQHAPVMAVAGVVRPKLIVSQRVMKTLTPEQCDVAIRHERAHRVSRDNLKRLLCVLTPDALPWLSGSRSLEHAWAKYAEYAADDRAVDGNSERALSLAAALICVAKLGAGQPECLLSTLVCREDDLRERVDRLLSTEHHVEKPADGFSAMIGTVTTQSAFVLGVLGSILLWSGSLGPVHQMIEILIQ